MEATGHPVDQNRILLWDNLSSHLTNQVHVTVYGPPNPANNHFDIVPCSNLTVDSVTHR